MSNSDIGKEPTIVRRAPLRLFNYFGPAVDTRFPNVVVDIRDPGLTVVDNLIANHIGIGTVRLFPVGSDRRIGDENLSPEAGRISGGPSCLGGVSSDAGVENGAVLYSVTDCVSCGLVPVGEEFDCFQSVFVRETYDSLLDDVSQVSCVFDNTHSSTPVMMS